MAAKKILMRSGKDPFKVVSAENTLASNLIGNNAGNLLFSTAATRILSARGVEIHANGLGPNPKDASRIDERYDVLVLPFANAFRPQFEGRLRRFTELIERLSIPVVVFGCGAQSTLDYDFERLSPIDATVKDFARAVLNRSSVIGVRGEFTEAYLRRLGFKDVEVIGCPSMFLFGGDIKIDESRWQRDDAPIAVNASSSNSELLGGVIQELAAESSRLHYVAQDSRELEQLLWGQSIETATKTGAFPANVKHRLYQDGRVRFFLDPWTWIEWMRGAAFSFGTRIHGNLAALLAGTPAFVLAHDSRTLELARYFGVPHRTLTAPPPALRPDALLADADFGPLVGGQNERRARMASFLARNGLDHTLDDVATGAAFEERLRATPYPPPVVPAHAAGPAELVRRIRWLRSRHERKLADLTERVDRLERGRP